eukprot:219077_1
MATTRSSEYFSECNDFVRDRIQKEKKIAVNKFNRSRDVDIQALVTTFRSIAFRQHINSDTFSYGKLSKLLINFHVLELILNKPPNKMILACIMCIFSMFYKNSGIQSKVYATNASDQGDSFMNHFLFVSRKTHAINKKILKNLLFYSAICTNEHTAAMVSAAVIYKKTRLNLVFEESSIIENGFKETSATRDSVGSSIMFRPRITKSIETIPYKTSNSNNSNNSITNPRNHATENDIPSSNQIIEQNMILYPSISIVSEEIIGAAVTVKQHGDPTQYSITTTEQQNVHVKIFQAAPFKDVVIVHIGYDQAVYTLESTENVSDICGATAPIMAKLSHTFESAVSRVMTAILTYIESDSKDINPLNHAFASVRQLLENCSNTDKIHALLHKLESYMKENIINVSISGEHVFYKMNVQSVEFMQENNDEFKVNKGMIWIDSIDDIPRLWKSGSFVMSEKIELLHAAIVNNGIVKFGCQYNDHYYIAILKREKIGDELVAIWWVQDTRPPTFDTVSQRRPFAFLSELIFNYHKFNAQRMFALAILESLLIGVTHLSYKTKEFASDVMRVLNFMSLHNEFGTDFSLPTTQYINSALSQGAVSQILEDIRRYQPIQTDPEEIKKNAQVLVTTYLNQLQVDTSEIFRRMLFLRQVQIVTIETFETVGHIANDGDSKWDIEVINVIHTFHSVTKLIQNDENNSFADMEQSLLDVHDTVQQQQQSILDTLFCTEVHSQQITCPECRAILTHFN